MTITTDTHNARNTDGLLDDHVSYARQGRWNKVSVISLSFSRHPVKLADGHVAFDFRLGQTFPILAEGRVSVELILGQRRDVTRALTSMLMMVAKSSLKGSA